MLVDDRLEVDLAEVAATARVSEAAGYAGTWTVESKHDPFLPLALAAEHTARLELGTAIAVAFARNPMTLAHTAHDLQAWSGGRLNLGLGSQVRAHITRRFNMPWSRPADRMREFILALRAIWRSWDEGAALDFRGEFYEHTLMTDFFAPNASPFGAPRVFLAAVGQRMTEVAGEVADGLLCHPFTTEAYLRDVTQAALERGRTKANRSAEGFQVVLSTFVATGATEEALARAVEGVRRQVGFYGATSAYRGVLELHGWGELQTDLNRLAKANDWASMASCVTDEVLDAFAVVAEPDQVAAALLARFGDVADRLSFYTPYESEPALWAPIIHDLQAAPARGVGGR